MLRSGPVVLVLLAACSSSEEERAPTPELVARGLELGERLGCASCHAPAPFAPAPPAPVLTGIGARRPAAAIASALERHAPVLASADERAALAAFLVEQGGPAPGAARALESGALERGRQLYHGIGCVACHAPFEEPATLARPLWDFPEAYAAGGRSERAHDLSGVGARWTLAALADYLVDPLRVQPDGRMPSLALTPSEAAELAAYLVYEDAVDAGAHLARAPGLVLEYFEASFPGDTADFDALPAVRSEIAASFYEGVAHREDEYGLRFRGTIAAPTTGAYTFATRSDDGSMLYVDGELVVDNRGQHAPWEEQGEVRLTAGRHALELTYFEHLGGDELSVSWAGPGFAKRPLGFDVLEHDELALPARAAEPPAEAALVARGQRLFTEQRCGACHALEGSAPAAAAPAFAALDAQDGCLAERPEKGVRFALADGERAALRAALRAPGAAAPRSDGERLAHELARLDCGACHARGAELAGPSDARRPYFQVERGLDLGDEGRLPPRLDGVGGKLKPGWFAEVLERGGRARPYMRTRMPQFGAANVSALPALFAEVDAATRDEREPEFSPAAVEAGKRLAGTKGLGCIQCHELAGHPSIGIPAVDLARVHERIYPGWFRALLMDPIALKMNTRMPEFWVQGKSPVPDVCGGDPAGQVDALWSYLSLGSSMPLPQGLVPLEGEFEVEVVDVPVCLGVFMKGVSPRTVAVGLPERVHYAFDVEHSRLALAWRGRFFDATGTWRGRAGELEKPAGEDVLEFPPGEALMMLDAPGDPWPGEMGRAAGYRTLGRRSDAQGRPVFRYVVCGVRVEESLVPVLRAGGAALVRRITADAPAPELFLRAATGAAIERGPDGIWTVAAGRLRVRAPESARVVAGPEGAELRIPFDVPDVEVEYSW